MKTMKKMMLTAAAAAVVAVGAQAQTLFATIGEKLPISNSVEASGSNVTYEWYYQVGVTGVTAAIQCENGNDKVDCVVPANVTSGFTDGQAISFYRRAVANDCAMGNTKNTTPIVITFANVAMGGVRWANFNSTTPSLGLTTDPANRPIFATDHAAANQRFFQFNRPCAWSTIGDAGTPCNTPWDITPDNNGDWSEATAPVCPAGWRLPTRAEYMELINNSNPISGAWGSAGGVNGRFYGPKAGSCAASSTLTGGCVFFPAIGLRYYSTGVTTYPNNGYGWSSTQTSATNAFQLDFGITLTYNNNLHKAYGMPVRCVQ